ncbi:MAG: hypothetical protein AB1Z98_00315 [Nannocystaceae bacterium]
MAWFGRRLETNKMTVPVGMIAAAISMATVTACITDDGSGFEDGSDDAPAAMTATASATSTSGGDGSSNDEFGDGDSGGAEESGFGMDDDLPLVTSIPSIKEGMVEIGQYVLVEDALVTTPIAIDDEEGDEQELYAQDGEGGQYSGIAVRGLFPTNSLRPGSQVDLLGYVRIADGQRFIDGTVAFVEQRDDPPALFVEASALDPGSLAVAAHEGVLVRLENLKVGVAPDGTTMLDTTIRLDPRFADELPPLSPGDALAAVVGPLMLTPQGLAIGPRSADDLYPFR